jgi:predicted ATPase
MLKSIRLQNFFGFQDCTINLEKGANVLVGINGSGKSNFFKAIKLLSALVYDNELRNILYKDFGGIDNAIFSDTNKNHNKALTLTASFDVLESPITEAEYKISIISNLSGGHIISLEDYTRKQINIDNKILNQGPGYKVSVKEKSIIYENIHREHQNVKIEKLASGETHLIEQYHIVPTASVFNRGRVENNNASSFNFQDSLIGCKVYTGFDTTKESSLRRANSPSFDKYLLSDASNLASLLNDIKIADKETYNRIVNAVKKVNDKFIGVEFKQLAGFIEMWLEEEGLNRAISPIHISDGTLKFLCLMAILYNPNRGSVVCIDEPELGLHPDMIHTLFEAITFAAETSQIIISTHSADLLDYFELKQIRVFEKDEHNATTVKQFGEKEFEGWYEKFYPGEMWRAGNIGGNRW